MEFDQNCYNCNNFNYFLSITRKLHIACGHVSLHFNSHFSRWNWVSRYQNVSFLDFIGAEDDGGGGDN